MPSRYSPYAIAENEVPQWRPGEELAASAFTGMTLFCCAETLFEINRLFKKRQGLYFWCMTLGTVACAVDTLGIILKYLAPHPEIWPFYTLCLLAGWSTYTLCQLLVLYSRLHLVTQNKMIQRAMLVIIVSTVFAITIPNWIVVIPAYDTDPKISSVWSPRDAIVERYTQIGNTLVECIVSGVYINSVLKLMKYKTSVRQRRVLLDLIYVNVIAVAFDVLTICLVYLNQLGCSHPIQAFSYALKLRLEFIVLNQLMAVAARGVNRETFEEKRYHHKSAEDTFSAELRQFAEESSSTAARSQLDDQVKAQEVQSRDGPSKRSLQISMPSPPFPKDHHLSIEKALSTPSRRSWDEREMSGDTLQPSESPILKGEELPPRQRSTKTKLRSVRPRSWRHIGGAESRPLSPHAGNPSGTENRRRRLVEGDADDEEEIGLHMWRSTVELS